MCCVMLGLTHRQWQIVEALTHGLTALEVAVDLDISLNTVQTHIKRIYRKLAVSNRVELVRCVLGAGVTNSGD